MELFTVYPQNYYDGDEFYADFVQNVESDVPKKEVANIVHQYIEWKQNVWAARWKKDFYRNGRCPECGSWKLKHYAVDWEGSDDGDCSSIWKTECLSCERTFTCVSNDDGELLDHWHSTE